MGGSREARRARACFPGAHASAASLGRGGAGEPWRPGELRAPPRPAPVACAERWPLPGPVVRLQNGGRSGPGGERPVSHPHKGPGSVLAWRRFETPTPSGGQGAVLAPRCLAVPERHMGWGRGFWTVELMGGDLSWASLALVVMLLGICPWSLDRSFFFSFRTVVKSVSHPLSNLGVVKTTVKPKPKWERRRPTSTSLSLGT